MINYSIYPNPPFHVLTLEYDFNGITKKHLQNFTSDISAKHALNNNVISYLIKQLEIFLSEVNRLESTTDGYFITPPKAAASKHLNELLRLFLHGENPDLRFIAYELSFNKQFFKRLLPAARHEGYTKLHAIFVDIEDVTERIINNW